MNSDDLFSPKFHNSKTAGSDYKISHNFAKNAQIAPNFCAAFFKPQKRPANFEPDWSN